MFGPKHIVRGNINFRACKNDLDLWLPIAPDLKRAIEAMPAVGLTTFLVTEFGKPLSAAGFGNWFRERCDEAGLPQCSAHGLSKAIGRRMAESEVTQPQMKAVGGWKTMRRFRRMRKQQTRSASLIADSAASSTASPTMKNPDQLCMPASIASM